MTKTGYVVRRLMPIETERLQGFPTIAELDGKEMSRDEMVAFAIINGDIVIDADNGKVFTTRGPGGIKIEEPREIGTSKSNGYNVFTLHANGQRKQIRKHRAIWIAANGMIPEGMVVDHINNDKTDNRIENLQLLTNEENSTKAANDGLYLCGEDNPSTKVSADVRTKIAWDYANKNCTYRELAERYGISKSRVHQLVKEYGWTDIKKKCVKTKDGYKAVDVDETPDTPRYKAMGNSMAVPCMAWIGERIKKAEER